MHFHKLSTFLLEFHQFLSVFDNNLTLTDQEQVLKTHLL